MEEGIGSWLHQPQSDGQSLNLNILNAPFRQGMQNCPAYANPCSNFDSANGILPLNGSSQVLNAKPTQPHDSRGWFYCLPRFRQGFAPVLNSAPPNKNCGDVASDTKSGCARKRFLVFDQSGDQTTLIFSSGIGGPVNYVPSWCPKPSNTFTLNKEEPRTKQDENNPSRSFSHDEFGDRDCKDDDARSEMHEDSEELDALLYSDDESDYSEDEEEASTGHSPSITAYDNKRAWIEENGEEFGSSAGLAKRQKISYRCNDVPSLMDTASSVKTGKYFEYKDDAESSCGNSKNVLEESRSLCRNPLSRKEKIRETISILESIIPDVKGKDPNAVIDEAIQYLRSLKDKAKVLGLDGC